MTLLRSVRAEQSGNCALHAPFRRVMNSESHRRKCRCLRARSLNHLLPPSPFPSGDAGNAMHARTRTRSRNARQKFRLSETWDFVQLFSSRRIQFRETRYPVKFYQRDISRGGLTRRKKVRRSADPARNSLNPSSSCRAKYI